MFISIACVRLARRGVGNWGRHFRPALLPNHARRRRKDSPTRGPGSPPRTASPTRGKGSATQESITSSRLFRDISPTRVFTQAPQDSTRASLPELFKQKKGLQSLRPTYAFNPDTSQLGDDARQPKLLQRWVRCPVHGWHAATKRSCSVPCKGGSA